MPVKTRAAPSPGCGAIEMAARGLETGRRIFQKTFLADESDPGERMPVSRRCTATTQSGRPCRAWAVRGTDLCAAHSSPDVGAPEGNANARKHGVYAGVGGPANLTDRVADLNRRIEQLSAYIDTISGDPERESEWLSCLELHSLLSGRLGRLMRDRERLTSTSDEAMAAALNAALDELSKEWSINL